MRCLLTLMLVVGALQDPGGVQDASEGLELRVRPRSSSAPAAVRATAYVDRYAGNRALTLAAESPDYTRRSTVTLDGEGAARRHSIVFESLPAGSYEIAAILYRESGPPLKQAVRVLVHR